MGREDVEMPPFQTISGLGVLGKGAFMNGKQITVDIKGMSLKIEPEVDYGLARALTARLALVAVDTRCQRVHFALQCESPKESSAYCM